MKYKANICYDKLRARFRVNKDSVNIAFGIFYRPQFNGISVFNEMEVESSHSGPTFVCLENPVTISARTIQLVKIKTTPTEIPQETIFIGNPNLCRHYKLMVSDFVLDGSDRYIQISNMKNKAQHVKTTLKLAVDEGHENAFFSSYKIPSVHQLSTQPEQKKKFNINPQLPQEQRQQGTELLEKYQDRFVSDVSELQRCKYPPIKIDYDDTKTVRQRNYRMSKDEKTFAEEYIQKLLES